MTTDPTENLADDERRLYESYMRGRGYAPYKPPSADESQAWGMARYNTVQRARDDAKRARSEAGKQDYVERVEAARAAEAERRQAVAQVVASIAEERIPAKYRTTDGRDAREMDLAGLGLLVQLGGADAEPAAAAIGWRRRQSAGRD